MVNGPSGANAMQLAAAVLNPDPVSVSIKVSKPQKVFLFFAISSQLQNLRRCFQFGSILKKPNQITNPKHFNLKSNLVNCLFFKDGDKLKYLLRFSHIYKVTVSQLFKLMKKGDALL